MAQAERSTMNRVGARAVVLGAGVGGLLGARVLSEFYDEVVVVECDTLTVDAMPRRAVPQAQHGHALQSGGAEAMDRLFPGLLAELSASRAIVLENRDVSRVKLCLQGHWLKRAAAEFIDPAWRMAVNGDLALPQIPGRRTAGVRLFNWLTDHMLAAAAVDDVVAEQFLRVMGMLDAPTQLFRPPMLWRVATHSRRRYRRVP